MAVPEPLIEECHFKRKIKQKKTTGSRNVIESKRAAGGIGFSYAPFQPMTHETQQKNDT